MTQTRIAVVVALLVAVAAGSVTSPPARAGGPQPPSCPLLLPGEAVERSIAVGGGESVTARDPYGNLLVRSSFFFDFTVRASAAARARIARVTWALDGVVKRVDPTAPYEWKGVSGSTRMPAGDHVVRVAVERGTAARPRTPTSR